MAADPKPAQRVKATRADWEKIRQQFEHACCVSCGLAYQHLHHVAFRGADSGGDVVENLAPMCNSCHERFHKRADGWERIAASIRSFVLARESRKRYALETLGTDRFDARYPVPPWLALGDLQAGPSMFNRDGVE